MAKYVLYHVPFPIYSQWLTLATSDSERKSATTTSMVPAMAKGWGLAGSVEYSYGRHCTLVKLMFCFEYCIPFYFFPTNSSYTGFPRWYLVVKNLPANAGDVRNVGSIPGSGRSPGEEHGNYSSILTWRIQWTEEPGRLQSIGLHSRIRLKQLSMRAVFS